MFSPFLARLVKKSVMDARVREWDLFYHVELVLAIIFMSNWFSASNREKRYRAITSGTRDAICPIWAG
jgi:hypothetical protein